MRLVAIVLAAPLFADHAITCVRFSPDGSRLAVAGGNQVRITGTVEQRITSRLSQVFGVAWSPDGKWLAVAGGTPGVAGAVELWSTGTFVLQQTIARGGDVMYGAAFSPDSKSLAAASADHRAHVADVSSGGTQKRLEGHAGPVMAVAWAHDGATLASASADRSVRLWSATDGSLLRALTNHNGAVEGLVFSAAGDELYTASADATVRVWVPSNGRMKRILRGFDAPVLALDIGPRGLLAAGVADSTVRLISPASGEMVARLATLESGAWPQAVATSGSRVAWGSTDGRFSIKEIGQ
ncbi:MAG: WD40 repeat domain-containing protein [Acidobacteria bacterium]|nr:WD40 repeat domain-containing protein [Acidobacteriota bacterium]